MRGVPRIERALTGGEIWAADRRAHQRRSGQAVMPCWSMIRVDGIRGLMANKHPKSATQPSPAPGDRLTTSEIEGLRDAARQMDIENKSDAGGDTAKQAEEARRLDEELIRVNDPRAE